MAFLVKLCITNRVSRIVQEFRFDSNTAEMNERTNEKKGAQQIEQVRKCMKIIRGKNSNNKKDRNEIQSTALLLLLSVFSSFFRVLIHSKYMHFVTFIRESRGQTKTNHVENATKANVNEIDDSKSKTKI